MRRMLSQALVYRFACSRWLQRDGPRLQRQRPQSIAKLAASTSKESQACIQCHQDQAAPLAVQQWAESKHAVSGIGCYECHQAGKDRPDSFEHFGCPHLGPGDAQSLRHLPRAADGGIRSQPSR